MQNEALKYNLWEKLGLKKPKQPATVIGKRETSAGWKALTARNEALEAKVVEQQTMLVLLRDELARRVRPRAEKRTPERLEYVRQWNAGRVADKKCADCGKPRDAASPRKWTCSLCSFRRQKKERLLSKLLRRQGNAPQAPSKE